MYNWNKFFFRLTVVVSIIVCIIITHSGSWKRSIGPSYKTVDLDSFLRGLLGAFIVWALYFAIRWIYKGLNQK